MDLAFQSIFNIHSCDNKVQMKRAIETYIFVIIQLYYSMFPALCPNGDCRSTISVTFLSGCLHTGTRNRQIESNQVVLITIENVP